MESIKKMSKQIVKIVIIGEPAVGKTSLVKKYISSSTISDYRASIGTNISIKETNINYNSKSTKVSIQLWDIAGQERWTQMRHMYYRGSHGAFIVADMTRRNTFEHIETFWYPDIIKYCEGIPIILLANKSDLKENITEKELDILKKKINAKSLLITSVKSGDNIEKAFKLIAEYAIDYKNSK